MRGTVDGALYTIAVPANWNGTLALFSHGLVPNIVPGLKLASDAPDQVAATVLLQEGYALAGTSYSQNGWAVQQALHNQMALLNLFNTLCGNPTRTVIWGESMGGLITAALAQLFPQRFVGALPMCALDGGTVGLLNAQLDGLFAFTHLLAHNTVPIAQFTYPIATAATTESILALAQRTAQGRARIALFAALQDIPGWTSPTTPEPAPTDFAAQEHNQFGVSQQLDLPLLTIDLQADIEARAGHNYTTFNTGVNYFQQLQKSADLQEVEGLYLQAGLSLQNDLSVLQNAPRLPVNPQGLKYTTTFFTFNGALHIPVLTMHTTDDPVVVVGNEQAYADVVRSAGSSNMLRQIFVHRAGHCTFTPAEEVTAFHTLIQRVNTGQWNPTLLSPNALNQQAANLGPDLNVSPQSAGLGMFDTTTLGPVGKLLPPLAHNATPSAFTTFEPPPFMRPFDVRNR